MLPKLNKNENESVRTGSRSLKDNTNDIPITKEDLYKQQMLRRRVLNAGTVQGIQGGQYQKQKTKARSVSIAASATSTMRRQSPMSQQTQQQQPNQLQQITNKQISGNGDKQNINSDSSRDAEGNEINWDEDGEQQQQQQQEKEQRENDEEDNEKEDDKEYLSFQRYVKPQTQQVGQRKRGRFSQQNMQNQEGMEIHQELTAAEQRRIMERQKEPQPKVLYSKPNWEERQRIFNQQMNQQQLKEQIKQQQEKLRLEMENIENAMKERRKARMQLTQLQQESQQVGQGILLVPPPTENASTQTFSLLDKLITAADVTQEKIEQMEDSLDELNYLIEQKQKKEKEQRDYERDKERERERQKMREKLGIVVSKKELEKEKEQQREKEQIRERERIKDIERGKQREFEKQRKQKERAKRRDPATPTYQMSKDGLVRDAKGKLVARSGLGNGAGVAGERAELRLTDLFKLQMVVLNSFERVVKLERAIIEIANKAMIKTSQDESVILVSALEQKQQQKEIEKAIMNDGSQTQRTTQSEDQAQEQKDKQQIDNEQIEKKEQQDKQA
ncbi:MAG: hypothetical protein EZS28_029400, partial [Streblomastix strix]